MSDLNAPYPPAGGPAAPEPTPSGVPSARFIDQAMNEEPPAVERGAPQSGIGPFTVREWILIALGAILLVVSFFPLVGSVGVGGITVTAAYVPIWSFGISWLAAVGFPVVAVILLILRRFATRFRSVGALGIDQFASVGFAVAAFVWLDLGILIQGLGFTTTPTAWIGFLVALGGVFFTIVARFVPPFSQDFAHREETTAHPVARPVRPIAVRPRPQQPVPAAWAPQQTGQPLPTGYAQPQYAPPQAAPAPQAEAAPATTAMRAVAPVEIAPAAADAPAAETPAEQTPVDAEIPAVAETAAPEPEDRIVAPFDEPAVESAPAAQPEPAAQAPAAPQPFWALVPEERDVHDVRGLPSFRIGPTAWALVLEDHTDYFVVRADDGRIGYLHDVTGVTRG
ncbi:hypothetical protein [Microbacterium indicum]|uniref:hypothetical protein n=1 Tax=Microbacterium indicum TaxID=358100 RepID=UPI0004125990|nr:hypothetical protein [Microbacterium indicum]